MAFKVKPKPEQKQPTTPAAAEAKKMKDVPAVAPKLAEAEKSELAKEAAKEAVKLLREKGLVGKSEDKEGAQKIADLEREIKALKDEVAKAKTQEPAQADTSQLESKVDGLFSIVETLQESLAAYVEVLESKIPGIEAMTAFVGEFGESIQTLVDDLKVQYALMETNEEERFSKLAQLGQGMGPERMRASFERIASTSRESEIVRLAKECLGE